MNKEEKRNIIIDNYNNPYNRGLSGDSKYKKSNTFISSCIDNIDLEILIEEDIILDIRFDGEACAIATSATSIMIKTLIGKSVLEVRNIIDNYEKMINNLECDKSLLGELVVYDDIYLQPNRKKCALLAMEALKKVL